MARYNLNLTPAMENGLQNSANDLGVSRAEVMRRALELYNHVIKSNTDTVAFTNAEGEKVNVIVR